MRILPSEAWVTLTQEGTVDFKVEITGRPKNQED